MTYDVLSAVGLFLFVVLVCATYAVKVVARGKARFERVDRQGGSVLFGKPLLEMGYWSLQPVGKFLARIGISPNQISWCSLVFGGIAGVFLAYGYFGLAAFSATLSALMDTLDGMVSRMTHVASDAGEVLDAAIDRYVEFFYMAGLVLYYREIPSLQIVALFALMGSLMVSYSTAKAEALHIPPPPGIMRRPERAFYLILGAAISAFPVEWFRGPLDSPVPLAIPMAVSLIFIAVLGNIAAIERLYTIARERRIQEIAEAEAASAAQHTEAAPVAESHSVPARAESPTIVPNR